jgi:type IV secretion system protein VirD4
VSEFGGLGGPATGPRGFGGDFGGGPLGGFGRGRPRSPSAAGPLELLAAAAVAVAALTGAVVWASGELAGLFWSGQWPVVGVTDTEQILVRLPSCLADPRRAWPARIRATLPGPAGLYCLALVVTAAVVGGAVLAVMAVRWLPWPLGPTGTITRPGSARPRWWPVAHRASRTSRRGRAGGARWADGARWATGRDVRKLRVRKGGGGRLVLGHVGRSLIATEAKHSVLVLGPTQSGKTTGLAIPALLEWDGPVVATSVKGDLVAQTRAYRSQLGRTWVFDPTGTSGTGPTAGWSPLQGAGTWTGAQRMAAWLVDATPSRVGLSEGAFWFAAAAKLLAPLLLAAARAGRPISDVVRWTNLQEGEEVERLLGQAGEIEAGVALFASLGRDERIRSSIYTTLETVLTPYEDPVVVAAADPHEIDPDALLEGRHTLYLCGPAHEQARLQGVFTALVASVVHAAVERVHRTGRPLDPALLIVLDEAANIAPLRDLDTLASTAAGMGIQLVTVCQDLAQLAARYGTERARTIANNHRAKVVLSGIADVGTLDTLSGLAGEQAVREQTITDDLRDGRRTTSSSVAYRRLAPADELRRIRPGEGVLVYGYLPPIRLALRPWWDDGELRRRVAAKSPPPPPMAIGAPDRADRSGPADLAGPAGRSGPSGPDGGMSWDTGDS